ncbi:M42 family metallopeptidase [Desulfosporosinus sp. BICA1-9]|uniref:M42 family metallopeptidase n=1 Tax=Desulfosporosinus sp. BICA1-9 TaxID=1531958 RepID=UPI00054C2F8B|nr:M42 family metallopeptidase [Desulfosporosinus sp. BICA1-9]KJS48927.1 MAG: aminopeptidase [Peptococcaceae bacterium BRH_c23]KJS82989.1 MAG: aminopeptidase [Desulfosporosinus sp. BICA1-9]HBW38602.1 M42 family peptidase [Desulfosporosinus sp.]
MLLKSLSELNGTSGAEGLVRNFLRQQIEPFVETINVDKIGNLIATKNGHLPGPKVMLAAHMDEVALMIIEITSDGFLKFRPVGGIDARILVSKPVQINESLVGVIGAKAIHLQKRSERQKALSFDQLYIDIGAKSKEDAAKKVKLGDYAYFMTKCEPFGEGLYKGKAFDDRIGCAILVELLKQDYNFPLVAAFTVQEEVGLRGAKVAAYHVAPDFAIVIEGTVAADVFDCEEEGWVTELGQGPACSLMDRATFFNPELIQWVTDIARHKGIPLQFRRGGSGGNDAGTIHVSKAGIPTIALSVPCRYIHSFASVISEKDYTACLNLVHELLKELPRKLEISSMDKEAKV